MAQLTKWVVSKFLSNKQDLVKSYFLNRREMSGDKEHGPIADVHQEYSPIADKVI